MNFGFVNVSSSTIILYKKIMEIIVVSIGNKNGGEINEYKC